MRHATIRLTAYDWVPSFAQGHVRDLRVRWALEEAGLPYEALILPQGTQNQAENLARQPFGQVPAIEIDGETMFESGAIVWRIAEASDALMPADPHRRNQVLSWLFASLNSVEPAVGALATLDYFTKDEEVRTRQRPAAVAALEGRLSHLAAALGDGEHLVGAFTAADLMMATVLRSVPTDILSQFPALSGYLERCTTRPAFGKALAEQLRPFKENAARYETAA